MAAGRDTRWLDETEMTAWLGLIEVFGDVRAALDAELQELYGLSEGDYAVLVNLSATPGHRLRMCDLAGKLHLSPSGLTRRIDGLVKHGLVDRQPAPDDRRVIMAVLTPAGMHRLEQMAPDHVGGVRHHLLRFLTAAQVRHLAGALETVRRGREAAETEASTVPTRRRRTA